MASLGALLLLCAALLDLAAGVATWLKQPEQPGQRELKRWANGSTPVVRFAASVGAQGVPCGDLSNQYVDGRGYVVFRPCGGVPRFLVITVHCFGCTPDMVMAPFVEEAVRTGDFAIAAPDGSGHKGFNAGSCCGTSLEHGVDDVGHLMAIANQESKSILGQHSGAQRLPVFLFGHSNGGFLVSKAALERPRAFQGVVASAGHIYRLPIGVPPTPMYIVHIDNDDKVLYGGCCTAQLGTASQCCCGISENGPETCLGAEALFQGWVAANVCTGGQHMMNAVPTGLQGRGAVCSEGVGCKAAVRLCKHTSGSHSSWANDYPLARDTLDFFAEQLSD